MEFFCFIWNKIKQDIFLSAAVGCALILEFICHSWTLLAVRAQHWYLIAGLYIYQMVYGELCLFFILWECPLGVFFSIPDIPTGMLTCSSLHTYSSPMALFETIECFFSESAIFFCSKLDNRWFCIFNFFIPSLWDCFRTSHCLLCPPMTPGRK